MESGHPDLHMHLCVGVGAVPCDWRGWGVLPSAPGLMIQMVPLIKLLLSAALAQSQARISRLLFQN